LAKDKDVEYYHKNIIDEWKRQGVLLECDGKMFIRRGRRDVEIREAFLTIVANNKDDSDKS